MNQVCGLESAAIKVNVTFVPQKTVSCGPGSRIVEDENPHPRAASPYSVMFTGRGGDNTSIVPFMDDVWNRHRYVQFPGRSATNSKTRTVDESKSGEFGSSPFGPRLLS